MKNFRFIFAIFISLALIIGGVIMSISPIMEFSKRNFLGWQKTTAEVAGFTPITLSNGDKNYITTLSYQIENSRYEVTRNDGAKQPSFDETATVFYNPKNVSDAVIGEYSLLNLVWLVLPIAGLALLIFTLLNFRKFAKNSKKFESEEDNLAAISKIQNSETKLFGEIVHVETVVLPSGISVGRAIVSAKMPNGEVKNFKSEQIEGLTAGLLVSYLANPSKISISVKNGDFEDYYIDSEEILAAVKNSFETVREVNSVEEKNV